MDTASPSDAVPGEYEEQGVKTAKNIGKPKPIGLVTSISGHAMDTSKSGHVAGSNIRREGGVQMVGSIIMGADDHDYYQAGAPTGAKSIMRTKHDGGDGDDGDGDDDDDDDDDDKKNDEADEDSQSHGSQHSYYSFGSFHESGEEYSSSTSKGEIKKQATSQGAANGNQQLPADPVLSASSSIWYAGRHSLKQLSLALCVGLVISVVGMITKICVSRGECSTEFRIYQGFVSNLLSFSRVIFEDLALILSVYGSLIAILALSIVWYKHITGQPNSPQGAANGNQQPIIPDSSTQPPADPLHANILLGGRFLPELPYIFNGLHRIYEITQGISRGAANGNQRPNPQSTQPPGDDDGGGHSSSIWYDVLSRFKKWPFYTWLLNLCIEILGIILHKLDTQNKLKPGNVNLIVTLVFSIASLGISWVDMYHEQTKMPPLVDKMTTHAFINGIFLVSCVISTTFNFGLHVAAMMSTSTLYEENFKLALSFYHLVIALVTFSLGFVEKPATAPSEHQTVHPGEAGQPNCGVLQNSTIQCRPQI